MRIHAFIFCLSFIAFKTVAQRFSDYTFNYYGSQNETHVDRLTIIGLKFRPENSNIILTKDSTFDYSKASINHWCVIFLNKYFIDTLPSKDVFEPGDRYYFREYDGRYSEAKRGRNDWIEYTNWPLAKIDTPAQTVTCALHDVYKYCNATKLQNVSADKVSYSNCRRIYNELDNVVIKEYNIEQSTVKSISGGLSDITRFNFTSDIFQSAIIENIRVDEICFNNCRFDQEGLQLSNCCRPYKITLEHCNILTSLDLLQLKDRHDKFYNHEDPRSKDSVCQIVLKDVDVDKVKLDYINFELCWDLSWRPDDRLKLYHLLLEKFKKEGQDESYRNLDIEYKAFAYTKDATWLGYEQNNLDKWWWNYGYDKPKIIENSLIIFCLVILFNLFFCRSLYRVYQPENFKKLENRLAEKYKWGKKGSLTYRINRIPAIVAYSAYIFWGWKLDMSQFKFDDKWWVVPFTIIIAQYLSGIICLAYIVNLIVTK